MKNKTDLSVSCAIIKDLLPSYVDGLTSEETNQAVKEHTESCPECMNALRSMTAPEDWPEQKGAAKEEITAEIDYLKKVRKTSRKRGWITAVICLLIGFFGLYIDTYYIGKESRGTDILCRTEVQGNHLTLILGGDERVEGYPRYKLREENGYIDVIAYTAPASFISAGPREISYTAKEEIRQVRLGNKILWKDGQTIDHLTGLLFTIRKYFIGDTRATADISSVLRLSRYTGKVAHLLQTAEEPYGWIVHVFPETSLTSDSLYTFWTEEEAISYQKDMLADSSLMLASVLNLGYVTWQYETPSGRQEYTVTLADANAATGMDVKACYDSVAELQKLMDIAEKMRPKTRGMEISE